MSRDKQTEIQQFAIDLQNVSAKVSNIIMEETHEFVSQKHKYKSLKDFHEAHPKSRCQMEAEFLTELGYAKASEVAREFRQRMNEKMGKHTHLLGKEYVQRIMREIEKEYTEEEG